VKTAFPQFSGDARLWTYATDRALSSLEQVAIGAYLKDFIGNWTSHERPVRAAFQICFDHFVQVAAEIPGGEISGCGIDKLAHMLDEVAQELGFAWLGGLDVCYLDDNGDVVSRSRSGFRQLAEAGSVSVETVVFDVGLSTVAELRDGRFRVPAGDCWHGAAFGLAAADTESRWEASQT